MLNPDLHLYRHFILYKQHFLTKSATFSKYPALLPRILFSLPHIVFAIVVVTIKVNKSKVSRDRYFLKAYYLLNK
jgi:hypothetical protein